MKDILIPIKPEDLTIDKVMPYMQDILWTFKKNATKIRANYDYYCLNHNIKRKLRPHQDAMVNSIVLEPHLMAMVDWKVGYIYGFPMKYAQSEDIGSDDIKYLNKYFKNSNKRYVDSVVGTWAFATGKGFYFIQPKEKEANTDYEAPFEIWNRDADTCCKVRSSYNGQKELFDLLYTSITEKTPQGQDKSIDIVDIYFPDKFYEFRGDTLTNSLTLIKAQDRSCKILPLVEKKLHNSIGIVEMVKPIQDALDMISSNNLDNLQEVVNVIYKYKGISIGDTHEEKSQYHRSVVANGAIEIPYAQGMPFEPDLDSLKTEALNLGDVEIFKNDLKRTAYETAGVPLATSDTNSGGTTKSGSEVANGYDNAYNRALNNINDFIVADYELLEKILYICKNTSSNKVDNLHSSEIEIKYCLNLTDNILTKMQALSFAIEMGMPKAMALEKTKMSNDSDAEGAIWQAFVDNNSQEEL